MLPTTGSLLLVSTILLITSLGKLALAEVNAPVQLIPNYQPRSKQEVVIYYANETDPDDRESKNYATIINWLETSGDSKAIRVAEQLKRDLREFHVAVEDEVRALSAPLHSPAPSAVVIFSNKLVRNGAFLVNRSDTGLSKYPFATPEFTSYILTSNPLASVEVLKDALNKTVALFDPKRFDFVLITKSHGMKSLALTPRLAVRAEETSKEELLRLLHDEDSIPGYVPTQPWIKNRLGISKADFLSTLEDSGVNKRMFFSFVFLESCYSEVDDNSSVPLRMPQNLAFIATTHGGIPYRTIDYKKLLVHPDGPFSEMLRQELITTSEKPNRLTSGVAKQTSFPWTRFLYFLPLTALCLGFLAKQWFSRRSAA